MRIALSFMRRRSSRWPSFTAFAVVLGVAVGVASFLVVITVHNSFQSDLKRILLSANPHLMVFSDGEGIPDARAYAEQLRRKLGSGVESVALAEYWEGIVSRGAQTAGASIRALEGSNAANAADLSKVVSPPGSFALLSQNAESHSSAIPAILGRGLAEKIKAAPGDEVLLSTAGRDGRERSAVLRMVGTVSFGLAGYDERMLIMSFDRANALFGKPGFARCIEIRFKNPDDALPASVVLNPDTPYILRPWQQIDQNLFHQIERDGHSIKFIVMIITVVAAFNILTTLSISVVDRTRQIALLRSLGASRGLVLRVFVTLGTLLGAVGGLVGVGAGVFILHLFSGFELGELKATYFLERIPVNYDFSLIAQACGMALLLSFVSSLYPAWKAMRVMPLQGLRQGQM